MNGSFPRWCPCALLAFAPIAGASESSTSFEFTDTSGQFGIPSPFGDVVFTGGQSLMTVTPDWSLTGLGAWHLQPGEFGTIELPVPAERVAFLVRDTNVFTASHIVIYDALDVMIDEYYGNVFQWLLIDVGSSTQPIGRITFENLGAGPGGTVLMDDFFYCAAELGTPFCNSLPNSTGAEALLAVIGSTHISDNALSLRVSDLPVGQPGIFFYGTDEVLVPFGNGIRCVGGTVHRIYPFFAADTAGVAIQGVDLGGLPPGGSILGGSIWKFQAWYRDPASGGTGFNLSSAVSITFLD